MSRTPFAVLYSRAKALPRRLRLKFNVLPRIIVGAFELDARHGSVEDFFANWDQEISKLERGGKKK